jgi:hypothetical protein
VRSQLAAAAATSTSSTSSTGRDNNGVDGGISLDGGRQLRAEQPISDGEAQSTTLTTSGSPPGASSLTLAAAAAVVSTTLTVVAAAAAETHPNAWGQRHHQGRRREQQSRSPWKDSSATHDVRREGGDGESRDRDGTFGDGEQGGMGYVWTGDGAIGSMGAAWEGNGDGGGCGLGIRGGGENIGWGATHEECTGSDDGGPLVVGAHNQGLSAVGGRHLSAAQPTSSWGDCGDLSLRGGSVHSLSPNGGRQRIEFSRGGDGDGGLSLAGEVKASCTQPITDGGAWSQWLTAGLTALDDAAAHTWVPAVDHMVRGYDSTSQGFMVLTTS